MSSLDVIGRHKAPRRMIVGITGATGIIYGVRLLGVLRALGIETHLVVTKAGELTRAHETDLSADELRGMADFAYSPGEIGAALASGSFRTMGMVVAPCTGNTLAKLALGISDTPVTMACKAHLRNQRPVVLAISTNDALTGNAANLAALLRRRYYYFVPFGQDNPEVKPGSLSARMDLLPAAVEASLEGRQLEPILVEYPRDETTGD